jgi:hypothetical protein
VYCQAEEQQKRDAEAAAIAAAEAAALAVQLEYEASLPDDVKAKVTAALEREAVSDGLHSYRTQTLISTDGLLSERLCSRPSCQP